EGQARPAFLRPPAPGHEDWTSRRSVQPGDDGPVRRDLWLDPGARPRPLRPVPADQRGPRQERRLRQGHRGVLRRLRPPDRARPRSPGEGGTLGPAGSHHGRRIVPWHPTSRVEAWATLVLLAIHLLPESAARAEEETGAPEPPAESTTATQAQDEPAPAA